MVLPSLARISHGHCKTKTDGLMLPTRKLAVVAKFHTRYRTAFQKFDTEWGAEMLQSAHTRAEKWSRNAVLFLSLEEK